MIVVVSIGNTARIASTCASPCAPAPNTTRWRLSWRARWRVASADTAAVRRRVSPAASITSSGEKPTWENST